MYAIIKFDYSDLEFPNTLIKSSEQRLKEHILNRGLMVDIDTVTVNSTLKEAVEIAENWK